MSLIWKSNVLLDLCCGNENDKKAMHNSKFVNYSKLSKYNCTSWPSKTCVLV